MWAAPPLCHALSLALAGFGMGWRNRGFGEGKEGGENELGFLGASKILVVYTLARGVMAIKLVFAAKFCFVPLAKLKSMEIFTLRIL